MEDTQILHSLHAALDPKSLILSQFSDAADKTHTLKLTTESLVMERGPRYNEYSDLRDRKLRTKNLREQQTPEDTEKPQTRSSSSSSMILTPPPPKKQVKFNANFTPPPPRRPRGILTQSVPDFSSALRKENRKPASAAASGLPPVAERSALTPPPSKSGSRMMACGKVGGGTGSKSANSGDKRSGGGGLIARKSYASVEELNGLAAVAGTAIINGESSRGGLRGSGKGIVRNSVLGLRQF